MAPPSPILPVGFSLGAVFVWGTSDFLGGYASRRSNSFVFTSIVHATGLLLMLGVALAGHSPFPSRTAVAWALAAGLSGGAGLAIFYRALASGRMGLTAPVAAVLSAAIPTVFGIFIEGVPRVVQVVGFGLAAAGIWLISRPEDGSRPQGIGTAVFAGIAFAGFYLFIKQAGNDSAVWLAAVSRVAAVALTGTIVVLGRHRQITPQGVGWGLVAGVLDISGSVLFIRATQTGRLDAAVVISSLYPAITVLLARLVLKEHFTHWKVVGMFAALLAVPLIAAR
ncbi:MAG TPA: DMT family transporter [Terriglobales bacterium]|jgi:drug/metabolite transporter (DMT)-like permease|nr:DMT family transporter [Terriglobales bacterium]